MVTDMGMGMAMDSAVNNVNSDTQTIWSEAAV